MCLFASVTSLHSGMGDWPIWTTSTLVCLSQSAPILALLIASPNNRKDWSEKSLKCAITHDVASTMQCNELCSRYLVTGRLNSRFDVHSDELRERIFWVITAAGMQMLCEITTQRIFENNPALKITWNEVTENCSFDSDRRWLVHETNCSLWNCVMIWKIVSAEFCEELLH